MPINWNGDYVESTADKNTDRLGFGEIGGVGQLVYHSFRFADYEYNENRNGIWLAYPLCNKKNPPDLTPRDDLTGKDILTSLCDLAKRIDDFSEKPYTELILEWCKENMHPYAIDDLYEALTEEEFDIDSFDAELVAKDAIFSFEDFMKDLGKLYNAARLYVGLEGVLLGIEDAAYNMYQEGRHFEGLPYFEKYKYDVKTPDIDVSSANGDLLKEMQLYNEYMQKHPIEISNDGYFVREPYDDYERLRDLLIECIPDFRLRLKANPKTNRLFFTADVKSVFDIAWYTLARMMSEDPEPTLKGKEEKRPEGIMVCCKNCGRFIIRTSKHQQYCKNKECQKVRNAQNQREFRKRKYIEKAQSNK